jgi:hypothetical protein
MVKPKPMSRNSTDTNGNAPCGSHGCTAAPTLTTSICPPPVAARRRKLHGQKNMAAMEEGAATWPSSVRGRGPVFEKECRSPRAREAMMNTTTRCSNNDGVHADNLYYRCTQLHAVEPPLPPLAFLFFFSLVFFSLVHSHSHTGTGARAANSNWMHHARRQAPGACVRVCVCVCVKGGKGEDDTFWRLLLITIL